MRAGSAAARGRRDSSDRRRRLQPGALRIVVTEDDRNPCPVEQDATFRTMPTIDNEDDLVATSSIVEVVTLDAGTELSFGNVVRLSLAARSD
jgi:hypothetical protein